MWWRQTIAWWKLDTYRTPRYLVIDIWQIALFHRICQLGVVAYVVIGLVSNDAWALTEGPSGSFNAWVETGTSRTKSNVADYRDAFPYCAGGDATLFAYSIDFVYDNPECRFMEKDQISEKTTSNIFIMSLSIDTEQWYWPCAENHSCAGTLEARANGQCICSLDSVTYPVGIEEMRLGLEHTYETSDRLGGLSGSSNDADAVDKLDVGTAA